MGCCDEDAQHRLRHRARVRDHRGHFADERWRPAVARDRQRNLWSMGEHRLRDAQGSARARALAVEANERTAQTKEANMTPLIVYHGHCPDGFTAAWAAHRALKKPDLEPELYVGEYGAEPPYDLARNRDVYVVDFSYKRPQLEQLRAAARNLLVLDHHKTAQADLEGLDYCVFDMNRSGAGITWDYFFGDFSPRALIVDYVEDRDLWRFKLPHSEEISLRIRLTPHTIEAFGA